MSRANTQITVDEFHSRWLEADKKGDTCVLIDVRTPEEYARGHVPSAKLIPLNTLAEQAAEIERDRTVYLICQGGIRSAQAIGYLANEHGHSNLVNIDGGTMAWAGGRATARRTAPKVPSVAAARLISAPVASSGRMTPAEMTCSHSIASRFGACDSRASSCHTGARR